MSDKERKSEYDTLFRDVVQARLVLRCVIAHIPRHYCLVRLDADEFTRVSSGTC